MTTKQRDLKRAADERKAAKQAAHAAMMAQHAARREAIRIYEEGYDAWVAADFAGPMPIHPDTARERAEERAMDRSDHGDLMRAAQELGIDLDC